MLKLVRYWVITVALFYTINIFSQEIHTTEIGFHGGGSYFIGDVKAKAFDIKPDFGLLFRYVFNQRMTFQADYNNTIVKGDYIQPNSSLAATNVTLNQSINTFDFTFAFNFLDYGQLDYILNSSNQSAYIFTGVGLLHMNNKTSNSFSFSIPVGIGYKFKLSDRLNLNMQLTHRLMLSDNLEGVGFLDNPLLINGTNINNNDHLGTVTVGLSYGLFKRKCRCQSYK